MFRALSYGVLLAVLFLAACSETTDISTNTFEELVRDSGIREVTARTGENEVQAVMATREDSGLEPLALGPNLYSNPGFESGLTGWTGCATDAITVVNDPHQGNNALQVNAGNCFFRSAQASSGQELVLSCYIKINSGNGWTGMGMSFEDSNFSSLLAAPTVVATSNSYQRYETRAVAPANSSFLSMWIYSDNFVVVDSCSLAVEGASPPPPPPSGDNLLDNGSFESVSNNKPTNWSLGCGGSNSSISGRSGRGMQVSAGACVDQGLSSSDISALQGNSYSYSCYVKNSGGYASMSIFLNGQATSKVIPVSGSYQRLEITGNAGSVSSGFVSLYSEGNLSVDDCSLTTGDAPPPPPPPSDTGLIDNGSFESVNGSNKPNNWSKGCSGSHDSVAGRSGRGMTLTGGACVDQSLSSSDLSTLQGRSYTYSCYARNTGGFASISLFANGQPVSTVIPQSSNFQRVEITGNAPGNLNSGFVSIYSEAGLTVDDCSLFVGDAPPPPPNTCSGSASYTLTFTNSWTRQTHPEFGTLTDDPHYSDFKATNHNSNFVMWQTGSLASTGVKDVAERGNNVAINSEINSAISQGTAQGAYTGDFLDPAFNGSQRSLTVNVSPNYSKISVVSMIAPSPDWFIGLNGLEMCQNGQWRNSVTRTAFGYDSGTDDGSNFESANQVSSPFVPIFRFSDTPFGTFTLTRN